MPTATGLPPVEPQHEAAPVSLYVMFNPSSGNADDQLLPVLQELQSANPALHLLNMIELHMAGELTAAVAAMQAELRARVLVIGGDGTVSWALSLLYAEVDRHAEAAPPEDRHAEAAAPHALPAIAICPGGTGNDLSRVMGWGKVRCTYVKGD